MQFLNFLLSEQPISIDSMPICFISTSVMLASGLQYVVPTLKYHKLVPVAVKITDTTALQK